MTGELHLADVEEDHELVQRRGCVKQLLEDRWQSSQTVAVVDCNARLPSHHHPRLDHLSKENDIKPLVTHLEKLVVLEKLILLYSSIALHF